MERAVKINFKGADPDGLSAIPPDIYRDRFIRRMEELLVVDEADLALVRATNSDHKVIRGTSSSVPGNVEV